MWIRRNAKYSVETICGAKGKNIKLQGGKGGYASVLPLGLNVTVMYLSPYAYNRFANLHRSRPLVLLYTLMSYRNFSHCLNTSNLAFQKVLNDCIVLLATEMARVHWEAGTLCYSSHMMRRTAVPPC